MEQHPAQAPAQGGEEVAMQMRGGQRPPLPRGPLVAKTDHSPEQSPRNGRCHSSLCVAASQQRCQEELGQGVQTSSAPPASPSPPQGGEWWLGPLLGAGEGTNWIEHSRNTSAAPPWGKGV